MTTKETTIITVTDTDARTIAAAWHGGQSTALYALASTGAINTAHPSHDCEAEIADCIWGLSPPDEGNPLTPDRRRDRPRAFERRQLLALNAYIKAHVNGNSEREPVPGWAELTW